MYRPPTKFWEVYNGLIWCRRCDMRVTNDPVPGKKVIPPGTIACRCATDDGDEACRAAGFEHVPEVTTYTVHEPLAIVHASSFSWNEPLTDLAQQQASRGDDIVDAITFVPSGTAVASADQIYDLSPTEQWDCTGNSPVKRSHTEPEPEEIPEGRMISFDEDRE